jgi:hypothetical protein
LAWAKSNEVSLANTKVDTKIRIAVCNNRYPEVAGQYQRLTNASIDLKSIKNNTATAEPVPIVNQLMLGQENASLPICRF